MLISSVEISVCFSVNSLQFCSFFRNPGCYITKKNLKYYGLFFLDEALDKAQLQGYSNTHFAIRQFHWMKFQSGLNMAGCPF